MIKEYLPIVQNIIYPLSNSKVFRSADGLLNAEKYMIKKIYNLQKLGLSIEKFCELINTFSCFGEQLGSSLGKEYFKTNYMAHSYHGIGHVTRVMFWIHILCYLSRIEQRIEKAIQYAAFIHDLRRESNREDKEHGKKAAMEYEDFLKIKIPDVGLLKSSMNAVIYHCKDDSECPNKDLVWKVLKDADSLDRGRFGHPKGLNYIRKVSKGCDVKNLRLDIFRESPKLGEELSWLAYRIASITDKEKTMWSHDPYMDLKKVIMVSLKASLRNGILNKNETEIADEMLIHLSTG
ncbi:MAG: HD domain-containing protein [Candidatus Methanoperedens sp.]|nr:HD domain-containing protein [Candidatus Methanoperedens sp.]